MVWKIEGTPDLLRDGCELVDVPTLSYLILAMSLKMGVYYPHFYGRKD